MIAVVAMVRVKTISAANRERGTTMGARMAQAAKHAAQKHSAWAVVVAALRQAGVQPSDLLPVVVTLTRVSVGRLDDDNLRGALKHVRDGVAKALGVDDGSRFIRFRYAQRKGKRGDFGTEARIEKGVFRSELNGDPYRAPAPSPADPGPYRTPAPVAPVPNPLVPPDPEDLSEASQG